MSADTVSASPPSLRTAELLLEVAAGLARTATVLATTEEATSPQEMLSFAAGLPGLDHADPAPGRSDHDDQDDDDDELGELEQTRLELVHTRRFAVDAHELLDQAATQLAALQAQAWDYDRAAWLERARPLLAANPYDPSGHLPNGQPPP